MPRFVHEGQYGPIDQGTRPQVVRSGHSAAGSHRPAALGGRRDRAPDDPAHRVRHLAARQPLSDARVLPDGHGRLPGRASDLRPAAPRRARASRRRPRAPGIDGCPAGRARGSARVGLRRIPPRRARALGRGDRPARDPQRRAAEHGDRADQHRARVLRRDQRGGRRRLPGDPRAPAPPARPGSRPHPPAAARRRCVSRASTDRRCRRSSRSFRPTPSWRARRRRSRRNASSRRPGGPRALI